MKRQLVLAGISLLAMAALCFAQAGNNQRGRTQNNGMGSASQETSLTNVEKSVWAAYKNKQDAAFRKSFASDYRGVSSDGVKNLEEEVAQMQKTDLRDFSFADMKVVFPDRDTAILTYKVTVQGSSDGQDSSGSYYASSAYVKRGGRWVCVLHTLAKAQ